MATGCKAHFAIAIMQNNFKVTQQAAWWSNESKIFKTVKTIEIQPVASNFEKLYERLINNRVTKMIKISEAQAGGKKGIATVDYIIKLKEIIQTNKIENKPT